MIGDSGSMITHTGGITGLRVTHMLNMHISDLHLSD